MRRLDLVDGGRPGKGRARYWMLAVGVGLAATAGYVGYALYPRFDLPSSVGGGFLLLGAAAGVAAFFSPCSFPLLMTVLTRESGAGEGRGRPAIRAAVPVALGAAAFLIVAGSVLALGGGALLSAVTFTSSAGRSIRIVVGGLLVVLGLVQAEILPLTFHRIGDRAARPLVSAAAGLRRRRPFLGLAAYGFFYLLAGFG